MSGCRGLNRKLRSINDVVFNVNLSLVFAELFLPISQLPFIPLKILSGHVHTRLPTPAVYDGVHTPLFWHGSVMQGAENKYIP